MKNKSAKKIMVCAGAGCRAWASEEIMRELDGLRALLKHEGFDVRPVPCMNKCGGGASVKVSPCGNILKLRNPEETGAALLAPRKVAAAA